MVEYRIPEETRIAAAEIPRYRAQRERTKFGSCTQANQIFLKASGQITCSCMRYWHVLADTREVNVADFYGGELMAFIRESFRDGLEPFDFCRDCVSRISAPFDFDATKVNLHIEPSSQCNLWCSACLCTFERESAAPPRRNYLDFAIFEKMIRELHAGSIHVAHASFVGFGEPLFNSDTPRMIELTRDLFPGSKIILDTNANFGTRRAEEIADCGIDEIRLGIDGVDQASYETYRKRGDFAKAMAFAHQLSATIRQRRSKTKAIWKYILFRHNDTDEQIGRALSLAGEIGVPIVFDVTVGELASTRPTADIVRLVGARMTGASSNIDVEAAT